MTSLVTKYISKRLLGESVRNNFGTEDPYFEQVPATRLNGRPSNKTKKRRKALPVGISEHDGKVLTKVKRRAYRLDMSLFNCCGIRFGWSSVIGIVPGFGDALDAFMAVMVMRTAQQIEGGLPNDIKYKMIFNIILDFAVGLVPIIGDIGDAVFRANTRNAVVLEKYLREKGAKTLKAQGHATPVVDPSDPDEYDRMMREEHGPPPSYVAPDPSNNQANEAKQHTGSWFGSFGRKSKQHDTEQGHVMSGHQNDAQPVPDNQNRRDKSTLQKTRP